MLKLLILYDSTFNTQNKKLITIFQYYVSVRVPDIELYKNDKVLFLN